MRKDLIFRILLGIIIILALILRVYRLSEIPPSITWDEASVGYNSWTIANFGRDEYGKFMPSFFRSFGDDKHPIHIYLTSIFVKFLDLNEFSIRVPAAIFGTLNVFVIFLLANVMFKNNMVSLLAALLLAISPLNIHFSRFNHEANFVIFFFMLGLYLFYSSFRKRFLLPFSILSFSISLITYHPAKIIIPVIFVFLFCFYIKKIRRDKFFWTSIIFGVFFSLFILLNPQLLGFARISQTAQGIADIEKTKLYKLTNNELLGRLNLVLVQYSWHFSPNYLFIQGDRNARLSSQTGEFYKIEAIFLLLGVAYLLYRRSKEATILLIWAFIAPFPSAVVAEAPHAARSIFMMGSWHLISALGLFSLLNFFGKKSLKWLIGILCFMVLLISLYKYLDYYFNEFPKRYAIDWQYGMKQIVEYTKDHKEYDQIYITAVRSQPYIFALFYLKTALPNYLNTVIYNNSSDKSSNNVSFFESYAFGGWDPIASLASKRVLYVLSPSEYDGLLGRSNFDVKKVITYPNGTDAFYLVTLK